MSDYLFKYVQIVPHGMVRGVVFVEFGRFTSCRICWNSLYVFQLFTQNSSSERDVIRSSEISISQSRGELRDSS